MTSSWNVDIEPAGSETPAMESPLQQIADLLGGADVLGRQLNSPLDAHEMLLEGLPAEALLHLVSHLETLQMTAPLERAVGMSLRTVQRKKGTPRSKPAKALNLEQSGRTWKFAEILARATRVLGSQEEAEEWLERPAIGLDQHRPMDLLGTPAGVEIVEDFLTRLEYGVYA